MLSPSSLLGSLLLVCAFLSTSRASILTAADDVAADPPQFQRQLRSFPYSVSFYRMLGHDRQLRPYYGVNDEVAALIDSMNNDIGNAAAVAAAPSSNEEEVYPTRPRRSDGLRGYACRFKFCRIYDA